MWGSKRDQALLEICTIHETNIFKQEGLIAFRFTCFSIMAWLCYTDVKLKHGLHYEKYTVWGEISTLISFFLLTLCSIEKYIKNMQYVANPAATRAGSAQLLENGTLSKLTAFIFEWAFLCELTLTLLFWIYLWFICSDISSMSWEVFFDKLHYDLLLDTENYNHSLPVVLLMMEFCVNNIPFTWCHYGCVFFINVFYLFFQYNYCLITKEVIYQGIDWNNDALASLCKALSASIVTFFFFLIVKAGSGIKYWANGIS